MYPYEKHKVYLAHSVNRYAYILYWDDNEGWRCEYYDEHFREWRGIDPYFNARFWFHWEVRNPLTTTIEELEF